MVLTEKNIYLFVHKAFYVRHVSCSRMVKEMQGLYRDMLTADLLKYAVCLYASFEEKSTQLSFSS